MSKRELIEPNPGDKRYARRDEEGRFTEMVAAYDGPVMIGHGTTDIQVGLTDARALAVAQPTATLVVWEGVNHLLKIAPADRTANAATYANPNLPLAPGVVDDIAGFILQPR